MSQKKEGIFDLFLGDCLEIMRTMESESVDAIVTDPPAGIGFMGRSWDKPGKLGVSGGHAMPSVAHASRNPSCMLCGDRMRAGSKTKACECTSPQWNSQTVRNKDREEFVEFLSDRLREAWRLAKPGSYALVWALPRTSHWTGLAIEESGWVIRDRVSHLFGTGFPKSRACLKPACEDWWLAWKQTSHVRHLNIDQCRVPSNEKLKGGSGILSSHYRDHKEDKAESKVNDGQGRYPSNLIHDGSDEVLETFDKFGKSKSRSGKPRSSKTSGDGWGMTKTGAEYNDEGSPSRFFYCTETGQKDMVKGRYPSNVIQDGSDEVLDAFKTFGVKSSGKRKSGEYKLIGGHGRYNQGKVCSMPEINGDSGTVDRFFYCTKASKKDRGEDNNHPTVKSTELMRWLCRLITPPGGLVLDPFMGSGSTGKACMMEGFRFAGIESDKSYYDIAQNRMESIVNPLSN